MKALLLLVVLVVVMILVNFVTYRGGAVSFAPKAA